MTMMFRAMTLVALLAGQASASAQYVQPVQPPLYTPMAPFQAPEPQDVPVLQNDLMMKAGSDRVFFAGDDYFLTAASRATLAAHARWLIANPTVRAIIEGHADDRDTRAHAIAIGERRASAVRDFLVAQGVPAARLTVTSLGKERPVQPLPGVPGSGVSARVVTRIVR